MVARMTRRFGACLLTTMLVVSLAEDVSTRSNRAAESRTASRDGSCVGQSAGWHGRFPVRLHVVAEGAPGVRHDASAPFLGP